MPHDFRKISSMDHGERVYAYQKDSDDERFLDLLNGSLAYLEDRLERDTIKSPKHSILITGVPRSGTTYLYQLMAAKLPFCYISNLMARFYAAPLTGAWLQSRVIHSELGELASYKSIHGVTRRVYEPHEFGYFWARNIPFNGDNHEDIDPSIVNNSFIRMESILQSIAGIFQEPVLYKCMIAPFVLDKFFAHTSVFVVHIHRDRSEVVSSIIRAREARLGSSHRWWSIRPSGWREFIKEAPQAQICWQYDKVFNAIRESCYMYPQRSLEVNYADILSSPELILSEIYDKYSDFTTAFT